MDAQLLNYIIMGISGVALGASATWLLCMRRHGEGEPAVRHTEIEEAYPVPSVSAVPVANLPLPSPELADDAEREYRAAMAQAIERFDHDLEASSRAINDTIQKMSAVVVGEELEKYRQELEKMRTGAMATLGSVQAAVEEERGKLREGMLKDVEAEKERLVGLIDTRLGEAVNSFLLETLRHNVDLGAQSAYLMAALDEHKEELKAEVKAS